MALKRLREITDKVIIKSISQNKKDGKNNVLAFKIARRWEFIVGNEIATMMKVDSITEDGLLFLKVSNLGYVVEANLYKNMVRQKINTFFGSEIVSDVIVCN
jgi:hypothetical protein